jgi:anti-sigma-K factor RskA
MRCEHEYEDGAYVLGALSPAERAAYERHLATCSFCREAVADIAVLPGLLGRLDPEEFAKLLGDTPAQRNRMPDLVTAARSTRQRERRQTRRRMLGAALAAACVALVATVGAVFWLDRGTAVEPPVPAVAMRPVGAAVPVSANVSLRSGRWGTKVSMVCRYARTTSHSEAYTFRLVAFGPDNQKEQVGSWLAAPGAEVEMAGMTRFTGSNLSRLELIRYDGTPLLAYDVP